ncbi:DUF302 domain-containing protein [Hwanghaeella sp.]|uniref:DUF302 domain-containing protein n=1 Tax=Hwanghaeella sp. TaxID=2605943 RepID=UPI003CCBCF22
MQRFKALAGVLVAVIVGLGSFSVAAAPDGIRILESPHGFKELEERLGKAITDHGMLRVFKASASAAAKGRGITIPGDSVFGVYRNDFAVRMIMADPLAGTEAPILIHVMEQPDGTADLAYKTPSSVFAPYAAGGTALSEMAIELDAIFAAIAEQAVAP